MVEPVTTFLWGSLGSATAEVVAVLDCYQKSRAGNLPVRYRRVGFWVARVLLVMASGSLAVAYAADQPLKAVATGAATLVIIRKLGSGGKDSDSAADGREAGPEVGPLRIHPRVASERRKSDSGDATALGVAKELRSEGERGSG
jgi:hypothetical protein